VISIWWIADHSVRRPLDQPADNGTYTQPQKSTTEKQPEESFWQRTTSDPVAVWTFFLVLFTAVLSGVSLRQFKYLRRADRTARIAANAAQKSAEATLGMERPFVYLEKLELVKEQVIDVYDGIRRPVVRLGFRNYGRSPAFIIRFHMDFYIGKNLPVVPVYGQGGDKTNVIEPGKIDEFQLERFKPWSCIRPLCGSTAFLSMRILSAKNTEQDSAVCGGRKK
jgi:hypothetical protein